jgi:hypothetical protein
MGKRTDPAVVEQILADAPTHTVRQLAEKYGIRGVTIRQMLRKRGVAARKHEPAALPQKGALEAFSFAGKVNVAEAAKTLDIPVYVVRKALKLHGLKPSWIRSAPHTLRKCRPNRSVAVVAALIKNPTVNNSDLALATNVTREYVSQIASQMRQEGILQ